MKVVVDIRTIVKEMGISETHFQEWLYEMNGQPDLEYAKQPQEEAGLYRSPAIKQESA